MVNTSDRLDSWKEIAAYLRRNVSTVQRWEKREGLPVHRHLHDKLGSVYALRSELDKWWRSRKPSLEAQRDDQPGIDVSGSGGGENISSQEVDSSAHQAMEADTSAAVPTEASRRSRWLGASLLKRVMIAAVALFSLVITVWLVGNRKPLSDNPLANARFSPVTDFEGAEHSATISRDGNFIAFLSDRDGPIDVWVTRVGSGQFHNLTRGGLAELVNPSIRNLEFSPDGALVLIWVRKPNDSGGSEIGVWAIPTMGGPVRPHLEGVAEFNWSKDGSRLVYHTPGPGDPTFVKNGEESAARQIFVAPPGHHAHFPTWSPDGAFIYFVQGVLPDKLDVWRIRPAGGTTERITFQNSRESPDSARSTKAAVPGHSR